MKQHIFPDNFLWGGSTAAHQVEGHTHNQWSVWETANADRLARTAPQRLSWLPNWKDIAGVAREPSNYLSGNGIEHYARYREDLALLKQLHFNSFRFSVEWSRIEPVEGQWDESAITFYRSYIAEMKRLGIEPILTLWHWTMPVWFTDKGGFEKRGNVALFNRFVDKIAAEFGTGLRYVLTMNEPNVYSINSYMSGEWPPQRRNPLLGVAVYWHLALAHKHAYAAFKAINPAIAVGIPMQLADVQPVQPKNPLNRALVAMAAYGWNWWFLDRIRSHLDFVGINYYFTQYMGPFGRTCNPKQPLSDLGWYMEPIGIKNVLVAAWRRYKLPVMITENGLADASDAHRQWWLEQTIEAMRQAMNEGVDIIGYLHWSLLDNFEWAFGWWPKFGLIAVDRTTMRRTIRPSARWFAQWLQNNAPSKKP